MSSCLAFLVSPILAFIPWGRVVGYGILEREKFPYLFFIYDFLLHQNKRSCWRDEGMFQQVVAFAALGEDTGSALSTHMVACSPL